MPASCRRRLLSLDPFDFAGLKLQRQKFPVSRVGFLDARPELCSLAMKIQVKQLNGTVEEVEVMPDARMHPSQCLF